MTDTQQVSSVLISIVRALSPIEDDVSREGVELTRDDNGNLFGDCPWCGAQLQVTPGRGLFYCPGCAVSGDVIRWVREAHEVTFLTAVDMLALGLMRKIDEHRILIA